MRPILFWISLIAGITSMPASANVDASDYHAFWLWSAVRPQPVLAQADTLYILQGQISSGRRESQFIPQGIPVPRLRHGRVWLTYRVETLYWPDAIYQQVIQQIHRWKRAGNAVVGIQIDFDARTLRLAEYTAFLQQLRQHLPSEYALSITGLLDWSNHTSPEQVNQLRQVVDEVVIQTYQGRHTIRNYTDYLPRLARLQIPFKIGLVQHGEWQAPDSLAKSRYFRGYVVFLLNQ